MYQNQIKAIIMDKLRKRGCWGGKYTPLDSLVRWIGRKLKRNGKKVKNAIKQLAGEGYLLLHKKGRAVSLNPAKSREIVDFIERVIE